MRVASRASDGPCPGTAPESQLSAALVIRHSAA
jgi:hypothetical protein